MHPVPLLLPGLFLLLMSSGAAQTGIPYLNSASPFEAEQSSPLVCNCSITQGGVTYPISSLTGTESAVAFYDYGNPNASSANTGLELPDALILFLYEDINTGLISLFLIADIANSGTGGSMSFEANCLPAAAYVAVQDDPGEFNGSPPLITGNWSWSSCCTDGGAIENIGCNNSINLDLLVSSGLDSIVWLTGDIANPTQLLLAMTGEAITINCGGSACCPIGLDTEVTVTDASCEDTPDGIIALSPQDGTPAYSYDWSNGATTATNTSLLPGTYMVTVTDALGCTEEIEIEVGFAPGDPQAQSASIELCSVNASDYFDLTTVNETVNLGTGFTVLWYENSDLTGAIADPTNYFSGPTTVYAVVDNGFCLSDPVPVNLIILVQPIGNTASMNACEEANEMAIFDLTSLESIIGAGNGMVLWFLDPLLTDPISEPEEFLSISTIIYAAVQNGPCISEPVEIELIVDLKPTGDEAEMHLCGDVNNEAVFDLTQLETSITGGNGSVTWYLEFELLDPITSPSNFQTSTTTVYAVIFDGFCYSNGIAVDLVVELAPTGNPITITKCGDASGEATFNLWDYASQVSGGVGAVDWFMDDQLNDPITNPEAFIAPSTIIFATVDNGTCISEPVQVTLNVVEGLTGYSTSIQTCADTMGQGIFNLISVDSIVSGGIGSVQWYSDPLGNNIISNPTQYSSSGSTVYALITDGTCQSGFIPVDLVIISTVVATPTQTALCDEGSGMAVFNLVSIENQISGGVGQVNWFLDLAGTQIITSPGVFLSGDSVIYASVSAGSCSSEIVAVDLDIYTTPVSTSITVDLCGNASGEAIVDLTQFDSQVNGSSGIVTWYADAGLTMQINNPVSFVTRDTVLYVIVSNTECSSMPASVQISVTPQLTVTPLSLELCKDQGETIIIDLTQYNTDVGGSLEVHWFTDALATNEIMIVDSFAASSSVVIFANVTDGNCTSPAVAIDIEILDWPTAIPLNIQRCGDSNGQIVFDLTSVESLLSDNTGVVTWYGDSQLSNQIINTSSFTSGDTTLFALVTNGFCLSQPVEVSLDIVDSLIANSSKIESCAMMNDSAIIDLTLSDFDISGGNGIVYWFSDPAGSDTITTPTDFSTNSTTLYAMFESAGCKSNLVAIPVEIFIPLDPPSITCDSGTYSVISFSWNGSANEFGYEYSVNNGPLIGPFTSVGTSLSVTDLAGGDEVTISLWSIGTAPCGNSDTTSISCITRQCPDATVFILDPGLICSSDDPFYLDVDITGLSGNPVITWSGEGIVDATGLFDPEKEITEGSKKVFVTVAEGSCVYTDSMNITIFFTPEASFILSGVPCIDSVLHLDFNGMAFFSSEWDWNFAGAEVMPGDRPVDFLLNWNDPGNYELSLLIDFQGCISNLFTLPVEIEAPLDTPVITCVEEDYYSLVVSWEPVAGADEYIVTSSSGDGKLSGNTYSISNLPDNTKVNVTVTAVGSACGPSSSSIECQTLEYIPLKYFIPDIFSPDGDGLNDVFFIQSNSRVTSINAMRIFDRWGNLVFEDVNFLPNDPQHGWDGSSSEKAMNPGVYLYWAEILTADGDKVIVTGDVTLLK